MSRTRLLISTAPIASYFYMSAEGEPPAAAPKVTVEVEPPAAAPAPAGPTAADHAAVRAELESIRERLDTVAEEAKEWSKTEIQAALSRLENLEATATEGLKGLATQVQELRDTLTRKLQEPPAPTGEEPPPIQAQPPAQPPNPEPSDEAGGGTPTDAPAPSAPASPNGKKARVI